MGFSRNTSFSQRASRIRLSECQVKFIFTYESTGFGTPTHSLVVDLGLTLGRSSSIPIRLLSKTIAS